MPDIFNTLSTRLDLNNPPSLLPQLEALPKSDYKDEPIRLTPTTNTLNTEDKTKSIWDNLSADVNRIKPITGYEYTKEDQAKYPTQYRSYTILGSDIEDTFAQQQSAGRQLLNGTLKGLTTAGGTFLSSFLSLPQQIDSVLNNEISGWDEDSAFAKIQSWTNSFENSLPNYYSQEERNNQDNGEWYKNIFTSNFLGDKFIKNLGFTAGAIGATVVTDAALSLIPGVGVAGAVANTGLALSKMKSAWNGVSKLAQGEKVIEAAINGTRTAKNLFDTAKAMSQAERVLDGGRFALKTYLSAQGEAAIEGFHTYKNTREKLYTKALNGELTPEEQQSIDNDAMEAGRTVANYNLPLLAISNAVQFRNILSGKGRFGQSGSEFIKTTLQDGLIKATSNYSKRAAFGQIGKELVRDMITEGLEEGSQGYLSSSVHDYYLDKYDSDLKMGLLDYVYNNKDKYINSQLLEEMFIGGLTGALTGGVGGINRNRGMSQRVDKMVDYIQPSLDRFNNSIRHLSTANENNVSEFDKRQNALKGLYVSVLDNKKFGNMESLYNSIQELKDFDYNEFNSSFGSKFLSSEEKNAYLDDTLSKMNKIEKTIEYVDAAYQNPYKSGFKKTIQNIFSPKNELEQERYEEYFFNQWKETVGYNLVQLEEHKSTESVLEQGLKSNSFNNIEAIEFFKTFRLGNSKGIDKYSLYKKTQLKALKDELSYQNKLARETETKIDTSAIEERIQTIEDLLTGLNDNKVKLRNSYKSEEAIPEVEKEIRENLFAAVIAEEIGEEDIDRYEQSLEELQRQAVDLNNTSHHVEQAQTEAENNQTLNPITAQQVVEAEANQAKFEVDELEPIRDWREDYEDKVVNIKGRNYDVEHVWEDYMVIRDGEEIIRVDRNPDGTFTGNLPDTEVGEPLNVEIVDSNTPIERIEQVQVTETPVTLENLIVESIYKDSATGLIYKVKNSNGTKVLQEGTIKFNKFVKSKKPAILPFTSTFEEVILNPEVKERTQEDKLNEFLTGSKGYKGIFTDLLNKNKIEIEC